MSTPRRGLLSVLLLSLAACGPKADSTPPATEEPAPAVTPSAGSPAATAEPAPESATPGSQCATTSDERLQRLVDLIDEGCGCEGDAACDASASAKARAWDACAGAEDHPNPDALTLDPDQVQTLFAETERLEKCNDTVHRALVHVVD